MTWAIHLDVVVGAALLAGAYVAGCRATAAPLRSARAVAFMGALAGLLVALNGPIHDLTERGLFSAHMVQHLILTLVVSPLLLIGTPAAMAEALVGRPATARLLRPLTRPLPALGAYAAALFAWHLPGPYQAALAHHGVHFVEHASLVAGALLAWWPVLSPSRTLPALPFAAQILYLFVFGMPMTLVAAMITGADHVLYPLASAPVAGLSPLADQRLGGVLMWVPAGVIPLAAFTAVFFRWAAAEAEDGPEAGSPVAG